MGGSCCSSVLAPIGASAAAWVHRNLLAPPTTLETSALAGALAGFIFLGPAMAFFFAKLDNVAGLKRRASLYLHRDEIVAEAVPTQVSRHGNPARTGRRIPVRPPRAGACAGR